MIVPARAEGIGSARGFSQMHCMQREVLLVLHAQACA